MSFCIDGVVFLIFCVQVSKMLEMDPTKRISAVEALQHPYFDNVQLPEGMPKYVHVEMKGSQRSKRR